MSKGSDFTLCKYFELQNSPFFFVGLFVVAKFFWWVGVKLLFIDIENVNMDMNERCSAYDM